MVATPEARISDYDFTTIGGDAAAFAAATNANELGLTTVMISDSLPINGACANVGCVAIPYANELELAALPQPQQNADVAKMLMASSTPLARRPVL